MRPVRSIAISGLRGIGRTRLYKQCESDLRKRLPHLTFAFLGNPLGELPIPLLAGLDHQLHPTTVLLDCWKHLNQFCIDRLRPALVAGEIAVMDGFGVNALLHATACNDRGTEAEEETIRFHHQLVAARVGAQKIDPPQYYIATASPATAEECLLHTTPPARNLTVAARRAFIAHELRIIEDYFRPGNNQYGEFLDMDSCSREEAFERIVAHIAMSTEDIQAA